MQKSWIIFDADNTLWDIESLYDQARVEFCAFLFAAIETANHNSHGYLSIELIEKAQRHRDLQLYASLGYSGGRFARSFEDTATFFMPSIDRETMERVTQFALNVFDTAPIISDGLEGLLARLGQRYLLGIITAGDTQIQQRRLDQFRLRDRFHAIEIVDKKTQSVFEKFCAKNRVNLIDSWVIGDSIRSDILPARRAGLNAIHLQAPNWDAERDHAPQDTIAVTKLSEVWDVLSRHRNRKADGSSSDTS